MVIVGVYGRGCMVFLFDVFGMVIYVGCYDVFVFGVFFEDVWVVVLDYIFFVGGVWRLWVVFFESFFYVWLLLVDFCYIFVIFVDYFIGMGCLGVLGVVLVY